MLFPLTECEQHPPSSIGHSYSNAYENSCIVQTGQSYCNSLLSGISTENITKLQRLQNSAARIIAKSRRKYRITPILNSLHWLLRVQERIEFKLLSLVYQCVHDMAPAYLSELLQLYVPSRTLRSSNQHQLTVPSWKSKSFGCRTFTFCAASHSNLLPLELRLAPSLPTFKAKLKTFLFRRYV